jgi:hypothetical protein
VIAQAHQNRDRHSVTHHEPHTWRSAARRWPGVSNLDMIHVMGETSMPYDSNHGVRINVVMGCRTEERRMGHV